MEAEKTRGWGTDAGRGGTRGGQKRDLGTVETHEGEQETRGSGGTRGGYY